MHKLAIALGLCACTPLAAAGVGELADTCGASSSYDVDVGARMLRFERAAPPPQRIELGEGRLRVDGVDASPDAAMRTQLVEFEQGVRALLPRVKRIAGDGVDLAISALRTEAAALGLGVATREDIAQRLARHATDLKRRIAASTGTREWQPEALELELEGIVAEIAPLAAADLGQQALAATLEGDFERAAALQAAALDMVDELQPRLEQRMQPLRARVEALCPELERLHRLQRDLRGPDQAALHLLDIAPG
jgi:hypothetical protein